MFYQKNWLLLSVIVSLLLNSLISSGQGMLNGDFSINNGNDFGISGSPVLVCSVSIFGGATFEDGSVPNWIRTHGSPNFGGISGTSVIPGDNSILVADNVGIGEGIAGRYPFSQGRSYRIRVGIKTANNPSKVRVVIGRGAIPRDFNCQVFSCREKTPPQYNSYSPIPVPVLPTQYEVIFSSFGVGENVTTFNAYDNFDWIAIFPQDDNFCGSIVEVKHVYIWPVDCIENLRIPPDVEADAPGFTPFKSRLYAGYQNIYVGSVYGGTTFPHSATAFSNPSQPTIMEASKQITFSDNFLAEPDQGYLLALVNPETCDPCKAIPPIVGPNEPCVNVRDVSYMHPICGGTWSVNNTGIATLEPVTCSTATIEPITTGSVVITYTVGKCFVTKVVTVVACSGGVPIGGKSVNGTIDEHKSLFNNESFSGVQIYPSPATSQLNLSFSCATSSLLAVSVRSTDGRVLISDKFTMGKESETFRSINISMLPPGVYLVDVTSKEGHITKKIVKL